MRGRSHLKYYGRLRRHICYVCRRRIYLIKIAVPENNVINLKPQKIFPGSGAASHVRGFIPPCFRAKIYFPVPYFAARIILAQNTVRIIIVIYIKHDFTARFTADSGCIFPSYFYVVPAVGRNINSFQIGYPCQPRVHEYNPEVGAVTRVFLYVHFGFFRFTFSLPVTKLHAPDDIF